MNPDPLFVDDDLPADDPVRLTNPRRWLICAAIVVIALALLWGTR